MAGATECACGNERRPARGSSQRGSTGQIAGEYMIAIDCVRRSFFVYGSSEPRRIGILSSYQAARTFPSIMKKYLHSAWGAHLFTPANNAGFLTNLPLVGVTNAIIDIEYATRLGVKHDGRRLAAGALGYIRQLSAGMYLTIRVNMPRAWPVLAADLAAIAPAAPDCIRVPSVETPEQVEAIDALLTELEERHGLDTTISLHPMIENPQGLDQIDAIAGASPRVTALAFGGEDWAHNCGCQRTSGGLELLRPRTAIVAAAARAGVAAVDTVYNWLDDEAGFREDCERSRRLGFHGRATINPRQVPLIEEIYRPSESQLAWARRLLADLREESIEDHRVWVSHGVILDPMAVANARRLMTYPSEEVGHE